MYSQVSIEQYENFVRSPFTIIPFILLHAPTVDSKGATVLRLKDWILRRAGAMMTIKAIAIQENPLLAMGTDGLLYLEQRHQAKLQRRE